MPGHLGITEFHRTSLSSSLFYSARALIYIITGSGILLVPAIIDYIFFVQDRSAMFLSLQSDVSVGGFALTLWSVYFAILWAIYIASRWVILVLPAITMRIVRLLFGKSYVGKPAHHNHVA